LARDRVSFPYQGQVVVSKTIAYKQEPLFKRGCRKIWETGKRWGGADKRGMPDYSAQKQAYERRRADWDAFVKQTGRDELNNFQWYHVVDLGNGIFTPGDFDYRCCLDEYHFPQDMRGMKVLDVGSATGFFAFEFERRGAQVVSVELPSFDQWDISNSDKPRIMGELMSGHNAKTVEEGSYRHLHGPFNFCAEMRGSKVRRVYSTVYDLSPEVVGETGFDMVFIGDVLLHLFSPLKALDTLAPLCKSTLVISTFFFDSFENAPYLYFAGNESRDGDSRTWWTFNNRAMADMLHRVGFKNMQVVGTCQVVRNRTWDLYRTQIVHAHK